MLGGLGQVARIFLQRLIAVFGTCRIRGAALANVIDRGVQVLRRNRARVQSLFGLRGHHAQSHQHPFHRNKTVAGLFGQLFGLVQHLDQAWVHKGLRVAGHLGQLGHGQGQGFGHPSRRAARAADQI